MSNGRTPGPRRLYKDRENGLIGGVCAGVADYFGFDVTITRIVVAVGLLIFPPTVFIGYIVLVLLLPNKPLRLDAPRDQATESLQRSVRSSPQATLDNTRHRFRELDARMQRLEKYLTSRRFELDKEFEALRD